MGWGSLSCCSEQSGWLLWSRQTVLTITADVGWRYKALFAVAFQDPHPTISFVLLHDAQQLSLCDGYGALAVAWKKQKRDRSEQKWMRIRTGGAGVAPKRTFEVVQNCALAEGGVYVLELVIKLCVKVPCLVSCYTTKYIVGGKRGISSLSSDTFTFWQSLFIKWPPYWVLKVILTPWRKKAKYLGKKVKAILKNTTANFLNHFKLTRVFSDVIWINLTHLSLFSDANSTCKWHKRAHFRRNVSSYSYNGRRWPNLFFNIGVAGLT